MCSSDLVEKPRSEPSLLIPKLTISGESLVYNIHSLEKNYLMQQKFLTPVNTGAIYETKKMSKVESIFYISVQFSSVAQSCLTLCDPMNCSMPGLPVHHQLPEFTHTHVHQVSDTIQPSHPLSSPSPPAPNPSQHQGLFQ